MTLSAPAADLATLLKSRGETLAVAECAAGGLICSLLTDVPGSSAWFLGGAVTYSQLAKTRFAGVEPEVMAKFGAVSPEAALALARGIRLQLGASWGLAETGIAGPPGGRRSPKPVGLAYLAVVGHRDGASIENITAFTSPATDRSTNKRAFAKALLRLAIETIG